LRRVEDVVNGLPARLQPRDLNSALFWFPRVREAGLPVPKTIFVPYDHHAAVDLLESGEEPALDWRLITRAVASVGPVCFLRTDKSSAKHDGPAVYRVEPSSDLEYQVFRTIEDSEMKPWMSGPHPRALMFRQWLDLRAPFTAFNGLPVAREFRFFAGPDGSECWHPYWTEESILSGEREPRAPDWREQLQKMNVLSGQVLAGLKEMARVAAEACANEFEEVWSVDFAQDKEGVFWLIDMATYKAAYHEPSCVNKPPEQYPVDALLKSEGVV
jgi:hypothetical protein